MNGFLGGRGWAGGVKESGCRTEKWGGGGGGEEKGLKQGTSSPKLFMDNSQIQDGS